MRRRQFITLIGAAAAWPLAARAQQTERLRRIGVLMATTDDPEGRSRIAAFRAGLEEFGWSERLRNVWIDYRWAAGEIDRARAYARELVALSPDVILAGSTPALRAVQRETNSVPIVFAQVSDPIGDGFVASFAQPGGNITGFTNFEPSMSGKWVELLKEIAPSVTRASLLFNPQTAPGRGSYYLRPFEAAAPRFGIEPLSSPVQGPEELDQVIAPLGRGRENGLIVMPDTFTTVHRKSIISLAAKHRVPAVYTFRFFATDGGLISYGSDTGDLFRRAASYADRMMKGVKAADLPVQAPTKFELVINLKTARAFGIEIPPTLLARADEVIE